MIDLVDTHCHIHFADYEVEPEEAIQNAKEQGVNRLLLVGCTLPDSQKAVEMAASHDGCWASIGLHPHEGAVYVNDDQALQQFRQLAQDHAQPSRPYGVAGSAGNQAVAARKVVAVGETGLDYHYMHSPKEDQKKLLRFQLDLALEHNLPLIFHVRDAPNQNKFGTGQAFDDFWQIFDQYPKLTGVVHSFSAGPKELKQILQRDLYVGLNGIMTFTKNPDNLAAARQIPLDRLLLETDAPFLTPVPFRGKIGEPKYVRTIAEFLASLRGETLPQLASATTVNARTLFGIK